MVPPVAYVMDKYGRKVSLLLSALPLFLGWILIIFAKSVWYLYVARCLAGFGTAFCNIVTSVYIGEIADKDIRGKLGTAYTLLKLVAYLMVYGCGPFVSYTVLGVVCALVPVVFFATFIFMPETPYYLIKAGRPEEARANLMKLNGSDISVGEFDGKLMEIKRTVELDMSNKTSVWELFGARYRKSLLVMLGIKTLQNFSGNTAIDSYMQTILEESGSGLKPEIASIIYGFIQMPWGMFSLNSSSLTILIISSYSLFFLGGVVFLSGALVDRIGRKPILIISCLGCALSTISEGVYFYMQTSLHSDMSGLTWIPATGLIVFTSMSNFGVSSLPYVLLGEFFATNIKEHASSISILWSYLLAFLISKTFKPLSNAWGMYTMFWFYGGCCIVGSLYVYFLVPETKGKTFIEIQDKLNGGRNKTEEDAGIKI